MRILVLVLSYTEWPFDQFMKTQIETWDAVQNYNIDTVYYHGWDCELKSSTRKSWQTELVVSCSDAYEMMHWKFKLALDAVNYHDYDFIFRTNSCSYIVKDKLLEVAKTLPVTNCYAGYDNGEYISGAGIFFSPDVMEILQNELTPDEHGAEDVLIGSILKGRVPMTAENSRIDADCEGFHSFDSYHFRAKTSNDIRDRTRDIDSLKKLHLILNQ